MVAKNQLPKFVRIQKEIYGDETIHIVGLLKDTERLAGFVLRGHLSNPPEGMLFCNNPPRGGSYLPHKFGEPQQCCSSPNCFAGGARCAAGKRHQTTENMRIYFAVMPICTIFASIFRNKYLYLKDLDR